MSGKRVIGWRVRMGDKYAAPRWWGIRMTATKPKPYSREYADAVVRRLRTIRASFGGGRIHLVRVVKGGAR